MNAYKDSTCMTLYDIYVLLSYSESMVTLVVTKLLHRLRAGIEACRNAIFNSGVHTLKYAS